MENERAFYNSQVSRAQEEVRAFFRRAGFDPGDEELIDLVIVFDSKAAAKEHFEKTLGADPEEIPNTFSGTVIERTLFLVSREVYRDIWKQLYPEWPWTEATYHGLVVHELAHRAHESVAISRLGSANAMGPTWFFEGLAIVCAGQFMDKDHLLKRDEIERLVCGGNQPPVSYPLFGRLVRSLAETYSMKELIAKASTQGFPKSLWPAR